MTCIWICALICWPDSEEAAAASMPGDQADARVGEDAQPNLIADLTNKLGRTPQKRLEQLADFDEEQAAAILKQWMHGARNA